MSVAATFDVVFGEDGSEGLLLAAAPVGFSIRRPGNYPYSVRTLGIQVEDSLESVRSLGAGLECGLDLGFQRISPVRSRTIEDVAVSEFPLSLVDEDDQELGRRGLGHDDTKVRVDVEPALLRPSLGSQDQREGECDENESGEAAHSAPPFGEAWSFDHRSRAGLPELTI